MSIHRLINAAAVLSVLAAGGASAQDKIEIKVSHYAPPTHGWTVDVLQPWAEDMDKRTGGKVAVRIFAANSPFGNVANQADQVKAGVTDMGWGLNGVPRGRFLRTLIMDMPFMAETSDAATRAVWSMLKSHLAEDYKDFHTVAVMCHNAGDFFMRDKKLDSLEDLKGLRIRAPSAQVQALLTHIGATPVTMGPAQIYEALEKGTLDGISMVPDGVRGFRLDGLIKHWFGAKIYTTCFHMLMNQRKYESLPPDVKKAIDETTGDAWVNRFGQLWNKWDQAGIDALKARGVTMQAVPAETRAKWKEQMKPVIDAQLAELEKQGVANARQIYSEMNKRIAEFSKK